MARPASCTLKAIVLDWAGTMIDHGSRAPVEAFREIFRRRRVPITVDEARGPMGMEKRAHIAALAAMPRIADAWQQVHRSEVSAADIDEMYQDFLPVQRELLPQHADLIPAVLQSLTDMRQRGLRIGSSSGYAAPLMAQLVPVARARGLHLDAVVSASDVPAGRPAPWMIFKNMELLDCYPPASIVTVDDTTVGVEAGRNAGTWSVGVVETGNVLGLTHMELEQLPAAERESRRNAGRRLMREAGAHYAIDSVADLPQVLDEVTQRLARGECP